MNFFSYIGEAAKSPYALTAYLAAVLAWTLIAWRVQRHKSLLQHIGALPERDRLKALQAEMGNIPRVGRLDPEQYLRGRIHFYLFAGYVLTATVAFVLLVIAYVDMGTVTGSLD